MPEHLDRYGSAVLARRAELRAERGRLSGTHRAELRAAIALSRLVLAEGLDDELEHLGRAARAHADHPDRAVRRALPELLAAALPTMLCAAHARWRAELAPAVRRIAGSRVLTLCPGWPELTAPPLGRPPGPPPARRSWLAGAVEGLAVWRLALVPLAALPLIGLPALGGPTLAPVAVGAGVAAVVVVVRARRHQAERAAMVRWLDTALAEVRSAAAAAAERGLLRLEHRLAAELDAAVEQRCVAVESALRAVGGG